MYILLYVGDEGTEVDQISKDVDKLKEKAKQNNGGSNIIWDEAVENVRWFGNIEGESEELFYIIEPVEEI